VIPIIRLHHAMLYVRELDTSVAFYREAFGFDEIAREGGMVSLLRIPGSPNQHDLALLQVGADAPRPPRGATGLYHLAWEVPSIEDLAAAARQLSGMRALTGASDHGATKSLYGRDPDGIDFEVTWMVPRLYWGEWANHGVVRPLDLDTELERWGRPAARA